MGAFGWSGAFGLGVLTALHPCPLTTNLAAIALVSAGGGAPREVWRRSLSLVAGLCTAYAGLAAGIASALVAAPWLAARLPVVVGSLMGPLCILAGALMTGLFGTPAAPASLQRWGGRLQPGRWGMGTCFAAGLLLALGFCPATAGLFFAVLIPMAAAHGHPITDALAYGAGVGGPLMAASLLVGAGASLGARSRLRAVRLARVAGWVMVAVGMALSVRLL